MLPRPRLRMPLWAAFALVASAFVVRSVARGFDFALDLPSDAVVVICFVAVVGLVAWLRADDARDADEAASDAEDPES